VYASSSSVYGQAKEWPTSEKVTPRPYSPYGVTKLAAEHLCSLYYSNYGLDTVMLRYFTVYGPRQRPDMAFRVFCDRVLDGRPLQIYGDGSQTRDFTYVDDVVRANRLAGATPAASGAVLNIGGGSQIRLADAVTLLAELSERPVEIQHLPWQAGDVRDTCADATLAAELIDFVPEVSFDEGLRRQFEWATEQRALTARR
jgi:nucleoside-diphosphate-sugar epimerase